MKYTKPPVSFLDQIQKLKNRGLIINNEALAKTYLSNISFYRLRAYTYPFQNNLDPNHPFNVEVSFEQIIELYTFDRKLRLLVLDAIEKIEIAFRTQIIYQWAMTYGSHWQLDQNLYRSRSQYIKHLASLQKEIDRTNETFIKHYKETYTSPSQPPSWMSLEVSSFGLLSLIYKNLKSCPEKKNVAKHFGLRDFNILENWMHNFSNIRNTCAHHGRLWNRRIAIPIKIPRKPIYNFIVNKQIYPNKVYASLCSMVYIISIINPTSTFKQKVLELMNSCPMKQEKEMGFPINWRKENFWQ